MTGNRFGLTAALAGIAALGGAGTLSAVLPSPGPVAVRPIVVADGAAGGPATPGTRNAGAERNRDDDAVPGAGPFPRTSEPITSGVFDL